MPLSVYNRQKMSSLAKKCRPLSLYHLTVRVQYHSTTVATVVVVDIGNIIKETLRHNRCPSPSYTAYCKRRCPKKSGFSYLFIMPYRSRSDAAVYCPQYVVFYQSDTRSKKVEKPKPHTKNIPYVSYVFNLHFP